jgi:hypothetical protein
MNARLRVLMSVVLALHITRVVCCKCSVTVPHPPPQPPPCAEPCDG